MYTLAELRDGRAEGIDLLTLRNQRSLIREVQERLGHLGLLDPPADGDLGPVSHWAWREFCRLEGSGDSTRITAELARALLAREANELFPLDASGADLASRLARSLLAHGYWLARHPDCINIVYVEGHGLDGQRNDNAIDAYNDLRCVLAVRNGRAELLGAWPATTQPGWHYILKPSDGIKDPVKAAAHIALGQYKAWCVGEHGGSSPHEALVQRGKLRVHRDANRDGQRDGDPIFERADYGINQHHGSNSIKLGRYSAGCLVASRVDGHRAFMSIVKRDPRYQASRGYKFMTAVLGREQFAG
jgi:hypothetical protein